MITFNTLKTQPDKDFVEVYDGKSGQLISKLSGVHGKAISFTSNSHIMDVKFYSDGSDVSIGFEATYEPVCEYSIFFFFNHLLALYIIDIRLTLEIE